MCWKAWCLARTFEGSGFVRKAWGVELLPRRRQVSAAIVRYLRRHADAFAIHVARVRSQNAAAQNLAVAPIHMHLG